MNRIIRFAETCSNDECYRNLLSDHFPGIARWESATRETWESRFRPGRVAPDIRIQFIKSDDERFYCGWWINYQTGLRFEFEDGTVKAFETLNWDPIQEHPDLFKELVKFFDDYAANGYDLTDKNAVILDDDDLLVV